MDSQTDVANYIRKLASEQERPLGIVLAGHNGSGKSTFWYDRLADNLRLPLVNADRLTLSLLPPPNNKNQLKTWAAQLRDVDQRWQKMAQEGVQLFMGLAMDHRIPFAFETVFSYLELQPDGSYKSKLEVIHSLQSKGYFVVPLFVGLATSDLSVLRVSTRKAAGGHDVPEDKLRSRFPRTQKAIGLAALEADLTLMFDNSRSLKHAFTLARAQRKSQLLYDCRLDGKRNPELRTAATPWLDQVAPLPQAKVIG